MIGDNLLDGKNQTKEIGGGGRRKIQKRKHSKGSSDCEIIYTSVFRKL